MTQPGEYTFVPWFRRGAAADITVSDDLTATATGRATMPIRLRLQYVPAAGGPAQPLPPVERTVELVGPGDVRALLPDAVLRLHPPENTRDAVPGELAFAEFYDEDLPWRFTPARAAETTTGAGPATRLRPWLALLVLTDDEHSVAPRPDGTAVLTVHPAAELPPVLESWAWAHAQLTGGFADPDAAGAEADTRPDSAVARLLSPRRLLADTAYTGFLVPAFETGRLAGLSLDTAATPAQQASWGAGQADRRFPVYRSWRFRTGAGGGFEALCRGLTGRPAGPCFGKRPVVLDLDGHGLPDPAVAGAPLLEGALRPPDFSRTPYPDFPGTELVAGLESLVDLGADLLDPGTPAPADPIIAPPGYGRLHAGVGRMSDVDDGGESGWVRELNLDPRNRAAAGLGAQVVRDRQEEFMARAWQQVGRLRDANQRLREAELALVVARSAYAKHLDGLEPDRALLLTAAAHRGLTTTVTGSPGALTAGPVTVRGAVTASRVPNAVQDPAFRRLTRPARPFVRQATGGRTVDAFQHGLIRELDGTVSAAPVLAPPATTVPITAAMTLATAAVAGLTDHADEPKRVFLTLAADDLAGRPGLPTARQFADAMTVAANAWRNAHPAAADQGRRLQLLIDAVVAVTADGPGARMALRTAAFAAEFGDDLAGKGFRGVTAVPEVPPAGGKLARMVDAGLAAEVRDDVASLTADLAARLADQAPPPPPLGSVGALATDVLRAVDPARSVAGRVADQLPGLADRLAEQARVRSRRLQPVLAHPTFPDPMVEALSAQSADHVLPNLSGLPPETLTVMEPNARFIESYLAGMNTEMARELLWREYPTDLRGTCFRVFWDRADTVDPGAADVPELAGWQAALGSNALTAATPIVLVLRSELLRLHPNTLVYALPARWDGDPAAGRRTVDPAAPAREPVFHGSLDPDVALYGFDLTAEQAFGLPPDDPGWFFVLQERPGQPRFGLDPEHRAAGLRGWDDLSWADLTGSDTYLRLAGNPAVPAPAGEPGRWGTTSADLAAILLRSPVMYARHADDLLPRST